MLRFRIIETADEQVLPIALLRKQCEIVPETVDSEGNESHPDDDLLRVYLGAAVEWVENFTGLAVALRLYEAGDSVFPSNGGALILPRPPLVELESIVGSDDSDGLLDPDDYAVNVFSFPAAVHPIGGWPAFAPAMNAVRVRYWAGYSSQNSDAQELPYAIREALLQMVAESYANRETSVDSSVSEPPEGIRRKLRPLRVRLGMA